MFGARTKKQMFSTAVVIPAVLLVWVSFGLGEVRAQGWPEMKIRLLPDDAFALVETDVGEKIRHCPHHDLNGRLDEEQLICSLGTLDGETWVQAKSENAARQHLEQHYDRFKKRVMKQGIQETVNINTAPLAELVTLPRIGPVLAVKIFEYREAHGMFIVAEDVKKVDGIGQGTFYAIRHYICTD